jgi:hypothetical protein
VRHPLRLVCVYVAGRRLSPTGLYCRLPKQQACALTGASSLRLRSRWERRIEVCKSTHPSSVLPSRGAEQGAGWLSSGQIGRKGRRTAEDRQAERSAAADRRPCDSKRVCRSTNMLSTVRQAGRMAVRRAALLAAVPSASASAAVRPAAAQLSTLATSQRRGQKQTHTTAEEQRQGRAVSDPTADDGFLWILFLLCLLCSALAAEQAVRHPRRPPAAWLRCRAL